MQERVNVDARHGVRAFDDTAHSPRDASGPRNRLWLLAAALVALTGCPAPRPAHEIPPDERSVTDWCRAAGLKTVWAKHQTFCVETRADGWGVVVVPPGEANEP